MEQRMHAGHLKMEEDILGSQGYRESEGTSSWHSRVQHPPGKILLAMEDGRNMATNERLHYALDRYEQLGECNELESMMDRGLVDGYTAFGAFIDSAPNNFSVSHNGRRSLVADQATELLTSLSRSNGYHRSSLGSSYDGPRSSVQQSHTHRAGNGAAAYGGRDHAFFPGLTLPKHRGSSGHHLQDEEDQDDEEEDEYDDEPQHGYHHNKSHFASGRFLSPGMHPDGTKHYVGAYSPESRRRRIALFHEKRKRRVWTRKVKYDVRKNFADTRMRVKGRFVKKEDEDLLKELICLV